MLKQTEEGFAVWCPALPGCWSQGVDEEDALRNIGDAITEYLAATRSMQPSEADALRRRVTVAVA